MNLVSTRPNKRYPCFNQKEKPYLNNSFAHACYQKKNRALQMSNSSCGKNKHQSRPQLQRTPECPLQQNLQVTPGTQTLPCPLQGIEPQAQLAIQNVAVLQHLSHVKLGMQNQPSDAQSSDRFLPMIVKRLSSTLRTLFLLPT